MVKIISDSTCDLSPEFIEKYNVEIIPLHILLGDDEYEDGKNITIQEIMEWADANKTTPKTSAVSMDSVMDTFKKYLDEGCDIVSFSISASMSATNNIMKIAAEDLEAEDRIAVIDSANLSTGIGVLVAEAATMAAAGADIKAIAARMEELKPKVRSSFVVDTLTYLHRGGRCSGVAAMVGGVLKLHPKIEVVDGKMIPGKKYRGKIESVIMSYVKDLEPLLKKGKKDVVFITHSGVAEGVVQEVREYLSSLNVFDEIHETLVGGVVCSHCGPGTLGVLFAEN